MHELTFADAAIPQQVTILGLPLAPYCLRHELILLRQRSPCLSEEGFNAMTYSQQVFAVTLSVQLCAAKKAGWLWKFKRHDYALAIAEFRNYLNEGRKLLPALSSSNEADKDAYEIANNGEKMTAGRSLGSPLIAQLIHFCIAEMRLSYEEALESPFAHVGNLYFSNLESKGSLYIENQSEMDARADLAEKRREVKDEKEIARKEWEAATDKAAAYAKNPRIGNLFADEWHSAENEEQREKVFNKWGIVAETELAKAGIKKKENNLWQD